MNADINRTIEAVWRMESARIIAGLARMLGDLGQAEEMAQDALVKALETWPGSGLPDNPGAWLTTTARRKAIDHLRRAGRLAEREAELGRRLQTDEREATTGPDTTKMAATLDPDLSAGDALIGLMCATCSPVLSRDARVALTLKILGGLSVPEIARAFVVPEATIYQRLARAKRSLREARVAFFVPDDETLNQRLPALMEVIYLIFNEGYTATAGDDWMRPGLCDEALRLARILSTLVPHEAEAQGLAALLEIQASRLAARRGPNGAPVLLLDQNRSHWDRILIQRGLAALQQARRTQTTPGQYTIQAEIAACHAVAREPEETDWERIAALYDLLAQRTASPVVELNRAIAVSMAYGPAHGLEIVAGLTDDPQMQNYHLLYGVRADLLEKLGRKGEAAADYRKAAELTQNGAERDLLTRRALACLTEDDGAHG